MYASTLEHLQGQLERRASPLIHENGCGAVVYRDGTVPGVGVHRFIRDRMRGHAPGRARYAALLAPAAPRTLTRVAHPERSALAPPPDGMHPDRMLAAHYGQSFENEFYLRQRARGVRTHYGAPVRGSPLVRTLDGALARLGLDVVTFQYLVTHGFPTQPVQLRNPEALREPPRVLALPEGEQRLRPGQRYLLGAVDLVLRDRQTSGVILADLKTSSDPALGTAALTVENAAQLHLYAYLFQRMTRVPVSGLVIVVANPLYGTVRVHTLRFHLPLVTELVYRDQQWPLLGDFNDSPLLRIMAVRLGFLGAAADAARVEDMRAVVAAAPYVLMWLERQCHRVAAGPLTLPMQWAEGDLEATAQWLVALGLQRYVRQPWRFRPPTRSQWDGVETAVQALRHHPSRRRRPSVESCGSYSE